MHTRLIVLRATQEAAGAIGERAAAAEELHAFVRATLPEDASRPGKVDILLRPGEPAAAILGVAAEVSAGLIVVGTHGRGTLARAFLGSTAAALLRQTTRPVAVIPVRRQKTIAVERGVPRLQVETMLLPLDLRTDPTPQLAWAARLGGAAAKPPILLHVVPAGQARGTEADRVRAAAVPVLGPASRPIVREGSVVPEVIATLQQERVGLVIMGRSSVDPGAMAYDILVRTDAIVLMAM
jgi:nucleotide-binding universal stress UspA family protein